MRRRFKAIISLFKTQACQESLDVHFRIESLGHHLRNQAGPQFLQKVDPLHLPFDDLID